MPRATSVSQCVGLAAAVMTAAQIRAHVTGCGQLSPFIPAPGKLKNFPPKRNSFLKGKLRRYGTLISAADHLCTAAAGWLGAGRTLTIHPSGIFQMMRTPPNPAGARARLGLVSLGGQQVMFLCPPHSQGSTLCQSISSPGCLQHPMRRHMAVHCLLSSCQGRLGPTTLLRPAHAA